MGLVSQEEVFPWVEQAINGKIIHSRRQGGRESGGRPGWFLRCELEGADGEQRYYARGARQFGFAQQGYGLVRETQIMQILHEQGIPVPEIIAWSENPEVTLMEFVEGENDFTLIESDAERRAVAEHFAEIMAQWHSIDAEQFSSAGVEIPKTKEDYVLNDLKIWEAGCLPYLQEPVPLVTFTCKWLRDNIPAAPDRPVLVQGDTGPGQFLFKDSRVQTVVDWELAFLGDPMRELAQIRTRDVWYPTGNLPHWFEHYSRVSGVELDYDRLRYYSVFAMFITTLALSPYCQQPDPRDEHAEWYAQDVWSKRATAEALAEALAIELEPVEAPAVEPGRHARLFDILDDNLRGEQLPHIEDGFLQHRINMDLRLLQYMRNVERIGGEIDRIELDDIAQLLGRPQRNYSEAMRALNQFVLDAGADQYDALVKYFYRHSRREEILMQGAMGRAEDAFMSALQ